MKLIDRTGHMVETTNPMVIEQLQKYGAIKVPDTARREEQPKDKGKKKGE